MGDRYAPSALCSSLFFPSETDSNYGAVLTLWDRLFGTYCELKKDCEDDLEIGLSARHASHGNQDAQRKATPNQGSSAADD